MPNAAPEPVTDSCALPLARYRLRLLARERIVLPEYSGSTWRGLFGHGLRRTEPPRNLRRLFGLSHAARANPCSWR